MLTTDLYYEYTVLIKIWESNYAKKRLLRINLFSGKITGQLDVIINLFITYIVGNTILNISKVSHYEINHKNSIKDNHAHLEYIILIIILYL